ncbi:MAG: ABC transporter ATP-binding protein [Saprospiraceae bacterium]|nr:ABC transporter ATP-binding protein [Saprospiraceae bacterium]
MPVISTSGLTKRYGQTDVVSHLDLDVQSGQIYSFIGLNGAGKTTTMRMLLGMIRPTSGYYKIFDGRYKNHEMWRKIGYMIESTYAYPDLTVREYLQVFYHYYQLVDRSMVGQMINRLQLERYANTKTRFLSLGNLQRLGIARALMHQPQLLILDEPVNGLDPAGIVEIRHLFQAMAAEGTTIFISSHLLSEVAKISDRLGIIHQGRLLKELSSEDLSKELKNKLIIDTNDNIGASQLLLLSGNEPQINHDGEIELTVKDSFEISSKIAGLLVQRGFELKKLLPWEEDLETFFLRIINVEK